MKSTFFALFLFWFLIFPKPVHATDRLNHGVVLQFWAVNDTTRGDAVFNQRVRRAQVKLFSEEEGDRFYWFLMFDPSRATADLNVLQDVGIGMPLSSSLRLVAGHFKIRTTEEGLESSSELPLPERSLIGRYPEIGDRREPGLMLVLDREKFRLDAMVSNGRGPNEADANSPKRLTLRSAWTVLPEVEWGVFGLAEDFRTVDGFAFGTHLKMGLGRLKIRSEAVRATLGRTPSWGAVGELEVELNSKLATLARLESLYPTFGSPSSRVESLGFRYQLKEKNRISIVASKLDRVRGNLGSYRAGRGVGVLAIAAFQAAM